MKKLNVIFLILIIGASTFLCSCSASGGISVGKQQTSNVKLTK
ncbi:MAG: hypothetical protein WCZ90_00275 [Melioribacteraceae bacterium]